MDCMEKQLNTLVYKRTHIGDPGELGVFGIHDCMGEVRGLPFEAVIGVGGKSPDRGSEDIARKINWVGIKPCKAQAPSCRGANTRVFRGPLVAFEYFVLLDGRGPDLSTLAPILCEYMFKDGHDVRFVMSHSLSGKEAQGMKMQAEVQKILVWARNGQARRSHLFCKC